MEHLWTPWRYDYVTGAGKTAGCLLCELPAAGPEHDVANLILHRAAHNFVIINKFPYTNGHLMIAPYAHVPGLAGAPLEQLEEMVRLARACESILSGAYSPDGFNVGMNIGRAAGAGVADHLHLHVVPRWIGDASFMSTTAATRVVPESPADTFARLRPAFERLGCGATGESEG